MKKRLLFALMGMATAFSASAYEVGQVVSTPQGRFKVVGANVCSNGTFVDGFAGWNAISAVEGTTPADIFVFDGEGAVCNNPASTEGMYYTFNTADAAKTYLVSLKVKQAAATTPNEATRTVAHGLTTNVNLFNVIGNSNAVPSITAVGTDSIACGVAYEILPEVQNEITAVIRPDGVARTYFVNLVGINSGLVISDVQIQEVNELANIRPAQAALEYANTIMNLTEWDDSDELEALRENVEGVQQTIEDEGVSVDDLAAAMEGLTESTNEFLANRMDDYFPNALDKLPKAAAKVQKVNTIGNWQGYGGGGGRIHANANDFYDVGHYQMSGSWGNGNATGCIGLTNDIDLVPGSYVFSVEVFGGCRENVKNSWDMNQGLKFARCHLYLKNVETGDTVAITDDYLLDPVTFTKKTLTAQVAAGGKYQLGIMSYAKTGYEAIKLGSTIYVYNASFYAKTASAYSKAEMDYYNAVEEQVTAARNAINEAKEHIADASKSWGKAALQAVVDEVEPKVAEYEAMDEAAIIGTYDPETYETGATNELSQLVHEVYVNAAQGIIAANRAFVAQNDTLETLATAIVAAEKTFDRYTAATGRAEFEAAITAAKATDAAMKASDYSEENAATVVAAVAALREAEVAFKATLPAAAYETLVDVDFSNDPVLNEETGLYNAVGAVGYMELPSFYTVTADAASAIGYEIGIDDNGEKGCAGILRVGNGDAKAPINVAADFNDILTVSFDMYFGNLSGRYAGYKLVANDSVESVVCGLICSKYDGKDNLNTFGVNYNSNISGVGSSSASNAAIAEESNKTTFEISIDYASGEMLCTTSGSKGTFTTNAVLASKELVPATFVLNSNYNNADRRCWFDNLKVVAIHAGSYDGIEEIVASQNANGKIFSISGMQVKAPVKGINIINGKKYFVK